MVGLPASVKTPALAATGGRATSSSLPGPVMLEFGDKNVSPKLGISAHRAPFPLKKVNMLNENYKFSVLNVKVELPYHPFYKQRKFSHLWSAVKKKVSQLARITLKLFSEDSRKFSGFDTDASLQDSVGFRLESKMQCGT